MTTITNNKLTDETLKAWKIEAMISLGETPKDCRDYSHHEAILALVTELQERRKADSEPAGYHVIKECGKVGCSVATLEEAEKTRDFWNKKWIIRPYFYTPPARDNKQTDELVMWVKRLAHSLRNARPNSKLHDAAMDYLSRKGLISVEDVLR
ncbi:hypothetical protein ACMD5O_003687 [Salmonella enterica subsp. enterica serovar Kiambu]